MFTVSMFLLKFRDVHNPFKRQPKRRPLSLEEHLRFIAVARGVCLEGCPEIATKLGIKHPTEHENQRVNLSS